MNNTLSTKQEGELMDASPKLWTRNYVLIICINLITFFGFQMLMPTLPLFVEKLGGSQTEAGFVIGIFALSAVLIRPIAGRGLDLYGRISIRGPANILTKLYAKTYSESTKPVSLTLRRTGF